MALTEKEQKWFDGFLAYLFSNKDRDHKETPEEEQQRKHLGNVIGDYLSSRKPLNTSVADIVHAAMGTKYSVDEITDKIYEYYDSLDPNMTYAEICGKLPNDSSKPEYPNENEIIGKKQLTKTAVNTIIRSEYNRLLAIKDLDESIKKIKENSKSPNLSTRNFKTFMMDRNKDGLEENRKITEAFLSGDKNKIARAVEYTCKRYLQDEKIFDKKYTDKELIENYDKLTGIGLGAGMEYESFNKYLKDEGIKIDPKLQKRMDEFHHKANAFIKKYSPRMGFIASGAYCLGENEMYSKSLKSFADCSAEVRKGAAACDLSARFAPAAYGEYVQKTVFKNGDAVEVVFDGEGNKYDVTTAFDTAKYGRLLAEGKELYCIKKGETHKTVIKPAKDGFEMEVSSEPLMVTSPKERDEVFNLKLVALAENDKLSKDMKTIEENVMYQQYKLSLISAAKNKSESKEDFMDTLADLAAAVTIQKMSQKGDPGEDIIKNLASDKTLKQFSCDLKASGLVDILAVTLAEKNTNIVNMSSDELYESIREANTKLVQKEMQKTEEKPVKEENKVSMSAGM